MPYWGISLESLGPSGVFFWFGVDCPCRDDESCFDITWFHHVFVRCHTGAYHPSYLDRLKWVVDGMSSCH